MNKAINNSYKLEVIENVNVLQLPLGDICGIYYEIGAGGYQIFLDNLNGNRDIRDRALYILMKHHNSSQKGKTKVLSINDLLPVRY